MVHPRFRSCVSNTVLKVLLFAVFAWPATNTFGQKIIPGTDAVLKKDFSLAIPEGKVLLRAGQKLKIEAVRDGLAILYFGKHRFTLPPDDVSFKTVTDEEWLLHEAKLNGHLLPGMSRQDVIELMGYPPESSKDNDSEEWKYPLFKSEMREISRFEYSRGAPCAEVYVPGITVLQNGATVTFPGRFVPTPRDVTSLSRSSPVQVLRGYLNVRFLNGKVVGIEETPAPQKKDENGSRTHGRGAAAWPSDFFGHGFQSELSLPCFQAQRIHSISECASQSAHSNIRTR